MTGWQIGALALAAVLAFWMLGAYNRLVSLRNAVGDAWRGVDEPLSARATAVASLLAALRGPLAAETSALETLAASQARVADAARAMGVQPLRAEAATAFAQADAAFGPACERVLALAEAEASLRADAAVQARMGALQEASARLAFARRAFNETVQAYNDAVSQWPTHVLARLYGFAPGALL